MSNRLFRGRASKSTDRLGEVGTRCRDYGQHTLQIGAYIGWDGFVSHAEYDAMKELIARPRQFP
jgi:hypothetical protein